MADTYDMLKTLIDRDDVRRWASVNNLATVDREDGSILVGEFTVVFDEYGKVSTVERRADLDIPTAL